MSCVIEKVYFDPSKCQALAYSYFWLLPHDSCDVLHPEVVENERDERYDVTVHHEVEFIYLSFRPFSTASE